MTNPEHKYITCTEEEREMLIEILQLKNKILRDEGYGKIKIKFEEGKYKKIECSFTRIKKTEN